MTFIADSVNLDPFGKLKNSKKIGSPAIKQLILKANQRSLLAFKQYPLFFIPFFILNFAVIQAFEKAIEITSQSREGAFLIQAYGVVAELSIAAVLILAYGLAVQNQEHSKETLNGFLKRTFAPFAAESLKAFGHIILGVILLVIPGIVMYVLYTFLPYIVFFNKTYDAGNLSALKESKRLAKAHFIPLFAQIVLFAVIQVSLQLGAKILGLPFLGFEFVLFVLSFYFSAFSFMYFYELYKRYEEKI